MTPATNPTTTTTTTTSATRQRRRPGCRPRRRAALLAGVATTTVLVAAGCGGDEDVLRVYSGRHYGIERAFEQFTEETGVEVEFLTGNDAELRERIAAEGDETEADAYITVDAGNLAAATEQGLFQPIESEVLDAAIPAELSDPDGHWYGLTLRARTLVYNPDLIAADELPATYEELADPAWQGRVCMRVASNVYTQSLVASLIEHHGYDEALRIVSGWAANAEIHNNDVLILEAINDGLCEVGLTNHYYLARELADDPDFNVALAWINQGDRGVHVNVSGGGVTRYSSHPEEAQQFLEWLATDGQEVLVGGNYEFPANPDVEPDPLLVEEFGTDFVRDPLQASVFGALNADAVRLMDEADYG
jgi:iron(III) transport system substrate-binding protein